MEIAQTADHALRALLVLQEHASLPASDVADKLGLSRAIAQRALTTLHLRGYVHRDGRGRYSLGPHIISLAAGLPDEVTLAATPFLISLAEGAKETAVLALRHGDLAQVVAAHVGSLSPLRVEYQVGFRHPLNIGANGIVILAHLSTEEQHALSVASGDAALPKRLEQARQEGYASSEGQIRPDMFGIAAPIFGGDGEIAASISLVAPAFRKEAIYAHIDSVKYAADKITQQIGNRSAFTDLGRIHG